MAILARPGLVPTLPLLAAEPAETSAATKEASFDALYAAHGARIHRFLRDLLGDATLAKDATQETFWRAHKRMETFESGAAIAPWLFGIARNVSLELRKARARSGRWLMEGADAAADAPSAHCPEREVLGREALRVVRAALEKLPEERRAMLLLRLDHGLSYDDIALTMGCSLAKVKTEIFRARAVLRDVMTTYEGGER